MNRPTLLAATATLCFGASLAQASLVTWTIDSAQTSMSLSLADTAVTIPGFFEGGNGTLRIRNQTGLSNTWTAGNKAFLQGTFNTQYQDGSSIQFLLGDDSITGINSGNYRPNPAAFNAANTNTSNPDGQFQNASLAAGVYGFKLRASNLAGPINMTDIGFFNLYNVNVNVGSSSTLSLSGSLPAGLTFGSSGIDALGIQSSTMGVDGKADIIFPQPFPDTITAISNVTAGNVAAGLSSITAPDLIGQPNLRQMTIPFQVTTSLVVGGFSLPLTMTGTLVATANVPEPSTLLMAGMGLVGLVTASRRPRQRGRRFARE